LTKTYRFALLGDPVAHSRSPAIHRVLFALTGLEGEYETIRADEEVLADTVAELRAGTWDGLNITMPLKSEAARRADALSPQARRSGSVNTLLLDRRAVYGDSTDSTAFRQIVAGPGFAACSSVLILGAGGSAAAALAAIDSEHHLYVSARRAAQAEDLTSRMGGQVIAWGSAVATALVINTTPIGMRGETLPGGILEVAGGLIDLPYRSASTPAVERATEIGIPLVDGHEFLVRQAMESFAMWTGEETAYERVATALRKP
jgi:shikimate dehydrogenase